MAARKEGERMAIPIPIVDGLITAGMKVLDSLFMSKADEAKIELTKEQLRQQFELTLRQMAEQGKLAEFERVFKEHQAQRDFANDQFGKMEILKEMGWAGKIIALGRASIRWVITGGSMFFTFKIMNLILTPEVVAALAAGTLSTGGIWLIHLLVALVIGIPVFYVSGISVEKIMGKRNNL